MKEDVSQKIDNLVKNRLDFERLKDNEITIEDMARRKNIKVYSNPEVDDASSNRKLSIP
jgi:hypothetical protein